MKNRIGETKDIGTFYMYGIVEFIKKEKDKETGEIKETTIEVVRNKFVSNSARLIRDIVFGDDDTIKLNFGDLNLSDNDDWENPPPSQYTDEFMTNKLGEVPFSSKTKLEVEGYPAIRYEFVMPFAEYNGLNTLNETTKIVEWGLASSVDDSLLTKKNKRVVYKDQYIELTILYTIAFKFIS